MRRKHSSAGGFSRPAFRLSLRARMTLAVLLPLILIFGAFMLLQYRLQQKMLMENLNLMASQTALTIEQSLQQAMLNHDRDQLQEILDSIGQNDMLRDISVMDPSGKIIFSPDGRQVGETLSNLDPACQACHRLAPERRPASILVSLPDRQRVFRSMNPIQNKTECQGCHAASQSIIGVLLTDISTGPLEASMRMDMWQHLVLWAAAILVSGLVVNIVFNRFILSRIEALSAAIKKFGSGQPSSPLPANQPDEIGQVSLAFNEMASQIQTREAENLELTEAVHRQNQERGELIKRLITVQEDERMRIARELHDELGQALAVLALQTELAHNSVGTKPEKAIQILNDAQNLVSETTEQMYNMIIALRPSVLDDLGLAVALRSHAERIFADTGIAFTMDGSRLSNRLSPELEVVLYRVFQEALTNIFRHARASSVTIRLAQENGSFEGEICDDGQGFDPESVRGDRDMARGLGLAGMQERVLQQNGQLDIFSQPGKGTRIKIFIPVQEVSVD